MGLPAHKNMVSESMAFMQTYLTAFALPATTTINTKEARYEFLRPLLSRRPP